MTAITVLFHVPKISYVTFYDGGMRFETGLGFPTSKHPVWDASHFDLSAKRQFTKEVCNGRGCVDDLTRLQDFLVAWGCKPLEIK